MEKEEADCGSAGRSSFLIVGDIAIVNIKSEDELEEAGKFAECIVAKNRNLKSVFAKLSTEGEFRIPRLFHLLGEKRTLTIAKEYGLSFFVDLEKAYYNPRLSEEHRKIAEKCRDGELVLDLFSGIGGFSIHIAHMHRSTVIANDWNREAISLLLKSLLLNRKKLLGSIYATTLEAGELIEALKSKIHFDRIIMNSPTNSINYIEKIGEVARKGSTVHLYVLQNKQSRDAEAAISSKVGHLFKIEEATEVLEHSPSKSIFRYDLVRI